VFGQESPGNAAGEKAVDCFYKALPCPYLTRVFEVYNRGSIIVCMSQNVLQPCLGKEECLGGLLNCQGTSENSDVTGVRVEIVSMHSLCFLADL
jgi:hypothetical protein